MKIDAQCTNNYSEKTKRKREVVHTDDMVDDMLKIQLKRMNSNGSNLMQFSPATISLSPTDFNDYSQSVNLGTELKKKDATVVIPAADGEDELELTGLFEKVSLGSPDFESLASAVSEQSGRNFSLPFALDDED